MRKKYLMWALYAAAVYFVFKLLSGATSLSASMASNATLSAIASQETAGAWVL